MNIFNKSKQCQAKVKVCDKANCFGYKGSDSRKKKGNKKKSVAHAKNESYLHTHRQLNRYISQGFDV